MKISSRMSDRMPVIDKNCFNIVQMRICNPTDSSVLRILVTPLINFIIVDRAVRFTHVSGLRFTFSDYFRSALFDFQIRLN